MSPISKCKRGINRVPIARLDNLVTWLNRPLTWFFPTATDVRANADPLVTKFIASKDGTKSPRVGFACDRRRALSCLAWSSYLLTTRNSVALLRAIRTNADWDMLDHTTVRSRA